MKQSLQLFSRFAGAMLERLRYGARKHGDQDWRRMKPMRLLQLAANDLLVVQEQIRFPHDNPQLPELKRIVDAANRSMMAWDKLRDLHPELRES